jgi:tetratricopeptide (TPR) repeat protein
MKTALCILSFIAISTCRAQTDAFRWQEMAQRSYEQQRESAPRDRPGNQGAGSTVSIQQLHHEYKPKAVKQFTKSVKLSQQGLHADAVELLEDAVRIDPEFLEAHNNLAIEFSRLHQFDRALDEIAKVLAIDPNSVLGHANLAVILCNDHRYPDAAVAAQRTLQLDSTNDRALRVLAICRRKTDGTIETASR